MFRNRSADVHQFAMVPRADIPRSAFVTQHTHKTTLNSSALYPIYHDEVLPGESRRLTMTAFARMATPIFPVMDNLWLESFFFFVPYRLLWVNWKPFMGEQATPGAPTSFTIPQIVSPAGGYAVGSVYDYFGLPTVGQVAAGNTITHSALPLRAYNRIFQDWFRDENLVPTVPLHQGDGPDPYADYSVWRRGKRHDYFTSALPWPQKGSPVSLPLGTQAPVLPVDGAIPSFRTPLEATPRSLYMNAGTTDVTWGSAAAVTEPAMFANPALYADLSTATAATINQLRQAFQVQKLLERDARGGTRYNESLKSHFGVTVPDFRLQRPEYIGGGRTPVNINPVAQTSGSPGAGGYTNTPLGTLSAIGQVVARGHGFTYHAVEHGHIIGIVCIRADLTYQQGMRRLWSRLTRYDFYWPAFAMLGEQAILNKEIFCDGSANDEGVFGYNERWSEYRYHPSMISGLFRSTAAGTLDAWHLAQRFMSVPMLNQEFIEEKVPLQRILAVGAAADGQEFIMDSFFDCRCTKPLPLYSVPGLIDHF